MWRVDSRTKATRHRRRLVRDSKFVAMRARSLFLTSHLWQRIAHFRRLSSTFDSYIHISNIFFPSSTPDGKSNHFGHSDPKCKPIKTVSIKTHFKSLCVHTPTSSLSFSLSLSLYALRSYINGIKSSVSVRLLLFRLEQPRHYYSIFPRPRHAWLSSFPKTTTNTAYTVSVIYLRCASFRLGS